MALNQLRMTAVLVELARTLVADFSIQEMLDHIAESVVGVLGVSGAGVLLLDSADDLRFVAATDDKILQLEALQIELGEGPCTTSYATGERVGIPDLAGDRVHPRYSPRAAEAGFGAVYTFPLRLDVQRLGALDLYRSTCSRSTARSSPPWPPSRSIAPSSQRSPGWPRPPT